MQVLWEISQVLGHGALKWKQMLKDINLNLIPSIFQWGKKWKKLNHSSVNLIIIGMRDHKNLQNKIKIIKIMSLKLQKLNRS